VPAAAAGVKAAAQAAAPVKVVATRIVFLIRPCTLCPFLVCGRLRLQFFTMLISRAHRDRIACPKLQLIG
jgi:hypothetical protein